MIGATWRRYAAQLCYQFDLVDIIIVESIVRRRAAILRVQEKKLTLMESGAIVIQARWRCYDCTMNYLHSMADILIVQSVARRWIAMRTVHLYRAEVHYIAATTIQRYVRGWITKVVYDQFMAARKIQSMWRGYSSFLVLAEMQVEFADQKFRKQQRVRCDCWEIFCIYCFIIVCFLI